MQSHIELLNISYQLIKRLGLRKSFDPQEAIFIFGDPRSGSTWLAEMISMATERLLVDEPLNLNHTKDLLPDSFGWRQHIPENQDWLEVRDYFINLLSGKNIPHPCIRQNDLIHFLKSKNAVYKTIRGKRLLHWLKANIKFKYKPIFLIRHPLAMIHSLSKHQSWNYQFRPFELPKKRNIETYVKHNDFLQNLRSTEEQILAHWCMANEIYFKHDNLIKDCIIVKYEDLLSDTENTLIDIFNEWQMDVGGINKIDFRKPSSSSNKGHKILPAVQKEQWKKEMDNTSVQKYNRILEYFEIEY